MKLAQFFSRILSRDNTTSATDTNSAAAAAPLSTVPSVKTEASESLDTLVSGFSSIQSLLKDEESVELPAAALLARLPEAMRGPAWQSTSFPDASLLVDQKSLYEQLQKGRLQYPVEQFRNDVPPGWLNPEAKGVVDLDLAQVVDSIPPEFFGELAPASSEMREISDMHDYFTPKQKVAPPPAAEPAVSAPSPVSQAVEPLPVSPPAPVAASPAPAPVAPPPAAAEPAPAPVIPPAPPPIEAPVTSLPPVQAITMPASEVAAMPITVPSPATVVPSPTEPLAPPPPAEAAAVAVVQPPPLPEPATVPEPVMDVARNGGMVSSTEPVEEEPEAGWDGVETRLDAGGQSVDINVATLEDLLRLRGIGPSRAKQLLEYRQKIGRFNSIFDLAKVPGLGGAAFARLTGLSLKQRQDRHQILNQILGLAAGAVPSLADITVAITAITGAAAGVLTNQDGMPLAIHGMEQEEAEANAALTPQLFRRIGGYLRRFQPRVDGDALILPGSQGQLLLLAGDSICLILRFTRPVSRQACRKALQVQTELDWLLGTRAMVKPA